MAIRNIIDESDERLTKKSREVTVFDQRLHQLLDDLKETLKLAEGVGLAAPQVGVLRRVCVIDRGDGVIELVNPIMTKTSGRQEEIEGCLSCPGQWGITNRPSKVKVQYQDRNGKVCVITGDGILARALCHETDHLDGILFKDHVIKWVEK